MTITSFYSMQPPKCLVLVALVFLFATTTARKVDMKINLGGGAVGDFSAEEEFLQLGEEAVKTRFHGKIQGGGKDSEVFETQRFAREEDLVIDLPVPDGIYTVTLLFAETWDGAFQPGKRVFDVYLGSKPGRVVKVADNFDPFREGGRAAAVRKKYRGVATYGGLTIALRPIKQNPQIAGIMVSGFSYSEPLLDELPTVAGDMSEVEDFSILNSIGPRPPADPSILYDPGLNPKLAEMTPTQDGSSDTFVPAQNTFPSGQTILRDQQKPFGSPGHVSNAYPKVQESLMAQGSLSGYGQGSFSDRPASQLQAPLGSSNVFSDRPAPQLQTSSGTFRSLNPVMGTVRAAAGTVGSDFLPDGKLDIIPNQKTGFPIGLRSGHGRHRRHGRQLASIASEGEANSLIIEQGSAESTIADQSLFDSLPHKLSSSDYVSHQAQLAFSGRANSDYSTSSQSVEKRDKEILSNGQTTGYVGPMDVSAVLTSAQSKQGPNVDQQSNTHVTPTKSIQVPTESTTFSAPLVPIGDSPGSANLNSGSHSTIASKSNESQPKATVDLLNPAEHEPNLHPHHQTSFSDAPGNQEPAGLFSRGPSHGELPPVPTSRFAGQQNSQQIRTPAKLVEQREGVQPKVEAGESRMPINGIGRAGDVQHFDLNSATSGYDPQKENPYKKAAALSSELQGSRTTQPVERDPLYSGSQGIRSSTLSHATGVPLSAVNSSNSSLPKTQVETQNSRDGVSGFISTERASSETVPHTVRAFAGSGEVQGRKSGRSTEGARGANYQTISNGSMMRPSGEPVSQRAPSPLLPSSNSQERPMMVPNVASPGVHNGNGQLDGLCIHNSTHCSCGMVEQTAEVPEECLFVVDENVNPMICVTRPCSGKVVCACATGASTLCQRTAVKSILVRAGTTPPEGTEDPSVVACQREALEDGILILTPIL